jgi:3-keto-L-gulonate-6-phosphate decarboxylase
MSNELRQDAQKYVNEELIKQVYFQCGNQIKDGIYPDEIELIEYSEKLILVAGSAIAKAEREEILKIVEALNPEVARVIRERRG